MTVLAKKGSSLNPNGKVTLWTHTEDVWRSSRSLFGATEPTELAGSWFRFFQIPLERWPEFRLILDLAALWHDIGKATCSFQDMLLERIDQVLRHEYLSFLILREAMRSSKKLGQYAYPLLHTVLAHHLKSGDQYYLDLPEHDAPITIYNEDAGVRQILAETEILLGETAPLQIPAQIDGGKATSQETWSQVFGKAFRKKTDEDPSFLRALAMALIASDAAGSALRRTGLPIDEWLDGCFSQPALTPEKLGSSIIDGRAHVIERRTGQPFQMNELQKRVQNLPARAVVISPCGSGKTLAAFLWAQKQLETHTAKRIIFLYPTRNTATEGFRDYVSWGADDAGLMHGTSAFDLQGITFNGDEPGGENKDRRHQANFRTQDSLFALGFWNKKYISATVDSFLSFTANRYTAGCVLPLLCESLLVVDEVHALDQRMFRHLSEFLRRTDLPCLMMTATLSPLKREVFDKLSILVDDGGEEARRESSLPRYDIEHVDNVSMTEHLKAWLQGSESRLLVVRNQVSTCQATARDIESLISQFAPGTELLVYHSRFRLSDRKQRHEEAIRKFQGATGRVVLVSTQVCQMSLDLDAQSLYTELAPLPDLIQRMGRANRHGRFDRAMVKIFNNEKIKPYEPADLDEAASLLRELPAPEDTSQQHLAELMERAGTGEMLGQHSVPLFDSLPKFESQPYRDIVEFTADAVLDDDLPLFLELQERRAPEMIGLVVPVPKFEELATDSRLPRHLRIASGEKYCSRYGFGGDHE